MSLVEVGRKAPAFSLKDQAVPCDGCLNMRDVPSSCISIRDDTPGCTKEACSFTDNLPRFASSKAAVLGVSILDEKSKARFADKYRSAFPCSPTRTTRSPRTTAPGRRSRATAAPIWASSARRSSSTAAARWRSGGTT